MFTKFGGVNYTNNMGWQVVPSDNSVRKKGAVECCGAS